MQENNIRVPVPQSHAPGRFTRFLWWLATAEPELLKDCTVDRNRYAIVGMTVLGTWSFATLAWTYFFSTVTSVWAAIPLGLFMGGIVLTIDRALIKGIQRTGKRRWLPLVFRGALAMVIGLFMAQPALLYLFDKEIHVQVSLDNEQRKKEKRQRQDSSYQAERTRLSQEKNEWQRQLDTRYAEVSAARESFIAETDGTGGSRKIGLKDIAQAKQKNYEQLEQAYRQREQAIRPQLARIDSALGVIDRNIALEQAGFETLLNDGFITRIQALNSLVRSNSAVAFRYYLLVAILLLIELMPVISKTLLPEGGYEEKAKLREAGERELVRNNERRAIELKERFNEMSFEENLAFMRQFFNETRTERAAKMKEQLASWRNGDPKRLDELWEQMKHELLNEQAS